METAINSNWLDWSAIHRCPFAECLWFAVYYISRLVCRNHTRQVVIFDIHSFTIKVKTNDEILEKLLLSSTLRDFYKCMF